MGYSLTETKIPNDQKLFNPHEISRQSGGEPLNAKISKALNETLGKLRPLRDSLLAEDDRSRHGLFLAQVALLLTRVQHGLAAKREDFSSLIQFLKVSQ